MTEEPKDDQNLQRYELVYLISNKFSEDELDPIISSVIKLIKDNGGKIIQEENWGKKKLAYPIGQFYYGYYVLVEFDLPTAGVKKLEKYLRLSEEIIRHLIVRKRIKTPEEIESERRAAQKIAEQREVEIKKATPSKELKKKEDKKVDMEELDKKLDKILDDTEGLL